MPKLPTIHPRVMPVQQARNELSTAALAIAEKHDLSWAEYLSILNELQASALKYMLREERHPDEPDRPSGLA